MTTSKPLISVIMPVYNGGSTIRQAVESVFCQNIPLELLVIDDGSTDQTSEVLSVYQDRPDFHYLKTHIILELQPPVTGVFRKLMDSMSHSLMQMTGGKMANCCFSWILFMKQVACSVLPEENS